MTRTFIALELNQEQQRHLDGVIQQVALILPGVRFVDPASIHLTLAFLGELDDEHLSLALEATGQAAQQSHPFSYRLDRVGIFGPPRSPRVIWMGIQEPTGALLRLHRILNQQLEQRGFAAETRPFSPHLTLTYLTHSLALTEQQHLHDLLSSEQVGLTSPASYSVRALNVMKSELRNTGAHYTCLYEYPFKEI